MTDKLNLKPETLAAQALHYYDPQSGGLAVPIQPATTYARDENYVLISGANAYSRDQNPTYDQAEALLAELESGQEALLFASGMAAAVAVVQALKPGDHIVAPKVMYWGLRNWLVDFCAGWGLSLDLFDAENPGALARHLRSGETKLVWIETPCNPTWDVIDIAAAAEAAHAAGARLAVDSTVATPVLTKPLDLGADIVFHSATKYLNGHGDVLAGALVTGAEDEFWARVRANRASTGGVLGPFEAWLLLRGMRTLYLRVKQASSSAMAIAQHFEGHPKLAAVLYPGLKSHPGHAIAARQMTGGFGGMLGLRVQGAGETEGREAALTVAKRVRVFARATSLGGVESLIEHRPTIEGPTSPIPGDLLRLSIGIEDPGDLIADLEQALTTV